MKWGVPLLGLVGALAPISLVTMWVGSLATPWAFPMGFAIGGSCFGWMRYVTAKDDQRLSQWLQALKLSAGNRNRALFGARSYGPYRCSASRGTWRR